MSDNRQSEPTREVLTAWSAEPLDLPECPRWFGDGLTLVDILAGDLYRSEGARDFELRLVLHVDQPLGAVAPLARRPGSWIAAVGRGVALVDEAGGLTWIERLEPSGNRMNDGACDPSGRFWAGSMAYDGREGAGSLYRVEGDGSVQRVWEGITIANGPAFSADGRVMYLSDSGRGVILRFAVDESGTLSEPTTFATFAQGVPDGLTVDHDGAVWVAVWGAGEVRRYGVEGQLERILDAPAPQPAGVCFGGSDGTRLFVTSARHGLDPSSARGGALLAGSVSVGGPPAVPALLAP